MVSVRITGFQPDTFPAYENSVCLQVDTEGFRHREVEVRLWASENASGALFVDGDTHEPLEPVLERHPHRGELQDRLMEVADLVSNIYGRIWNERLAPMIEQAAEEASGIARSRLLFPNEKVCRFCDRPIILSVGRAGYVHLDEDGQPSYEECDFRWAIGSNGFGPSVDDYPYAGTYATPREEDE